MIRGKNETRGGRDSNPPELRFMNNLKILRLSKELTQKELGELIGMSAQAINTYEAGTREPNLETLNAFADLFGVSVDVVIGREPVPEE